MKTQQKQQSIYTLVTTAAYNPFFLQCDDLNKGEVASIHFFKVENGVGKIVASCKWFTILRGKGFIGSNNDFKKVQLPYTDIPLRKKQWFSKDLAFCMKTPDQYGGKALLELYLNVSELYDFEIRSSEPVVQNNGTEMHSFDTVSFKVLGSSRRTEFDDAGFRLREAAFTCHHSFGKTEFGEMCEEIANLLSTSGKKVSYLDVCGWIKNGVLDQVFELYKGDKD